MAFFRPLARPRGKSITSSPVLPALEQLEDRCLPSTNPLTSLFASPDYKSLGHHGAHPDGPSGPSAGYGPAQLLEAYGINKISFAGTSGTGAGQTIAIVDAYDDPSISTDLTTFDQYYGIAAPPSFVKVGIDANGNASTTSFPAQNSGWDGEIELDVEWAHAIAPDATIVLVEANSSSYQDLLNAINYARNAPGVSVVSMSWGGAEFSTESQDDTYFTTPAGHTGVTFIASTGDSGAGVSWPSVSSDVVAAGGTTLNLDSSGDYLSESGWSGSGGGISQYVSQPTYQNNVTIYGGDPQANGMRAVPDVAYDADPNTGVAVYGIDGWGGWQEVGGTSAASPQWAGIIAIADQGRALAGAGTLDGSTQTLPDLYQASSSDFNDITSGNNGYPAGPGYDLVTGRGSPVANNLMADLGAPAVQQVLTTVAITPAHPVVGDGGQSQLTGTGLDQFGDPMVSQPSLAWSLLAGQGTISSSGLYTAPASGSGTATVGVTASEDGVELSTTVVIKYLPGPAITGLTATPNPVTGTTTNLSAQLSDPNSGDLSYAWSVLSVPTGASQPTFSSSSGSTAPGSLSTTASFKQAGTYQFQLSVTDALGIGVTSTVTVTVNQTLTSVQVAPATAAVQDGEQQQFTATADDQFGQALTSQPSFAWSVVNAQGTITSNGLYTAPSTGTGSATVTAAAAVNGVAESGTATVFYAPGLSIAQLGANPNPVITGSTSTLSALISDPNSSQISYNWSVLSAPSNYSYPSLSPSSGQTGVGTLSTTATFYGPGTYEFQLNLSDNAGDSASGTVTVTVLAQPLTISPPTASPNPVINGTTTTLTAQVSDSNPTWIYYNWSVVSAPANYTSPTLMSPTGYGSNGPISTGVTFYGPGTYQFQLNATDGWGQSATSSVVTVTVLAQSLTISPPTASPNPVINGGTTTTLTAQVSDSNPTWIYYNWSVVSAPSNYTSPTLLSPTGYGSNGPLSTGVIFYGPGTYQFQLNAIDGWGQNSTSSVVTVTVLAQPLTVTQPTASPVTNSETTLSTQVSDSNPTWIYYNWSVVSAPTSYTAPTLLSPTGYGSNGPLSTGVIFYGPGTYQFEVSVNDGWGQNATSSVVTVNVTGQGPTITGLAASPSSVTGTTTTLSAQVSDSNPSALSYDWSVLSVPTGAAQPSLSSPSGQTAAGTLSSTATFYAPGTYQFQLTVTDSWGLSASGTVSVAVVATATTVTLTPSTANVTDGTTQQFTAMAYDQFHNAISPQPTFSWSITTGAGTVNSSGLYTSPATGTGTVTVQAAALVNGVAVHGTARVTLAVAPPTISQISANPNPVTGTTTTLSVVASNLSGGDLTYAWSVKTKPSGAANPTFASSTASSTLATFSKAGTYTFQVVVTSSLTGKTATATVSVTVEQTLTAVTLTPETTTVRHGTSKQFTAEALDQFGDAISNVSFLWSVSGLGTVGSNGLYNAPTSGTGSAIVKAQATVNGVTVSGTASVTIT